MSHVYCDLADVRQELVREQGSTTVDDDAISARLPRAAAVIDEFCMHSFDDETVTDERRRGEQVILTNDWLLQVTAKKANVQTLTAAAVTTDMRTWYDLDLTRCDVDKYLLTFYGLTAPLVRSGPMIARLTYQGGYATVPELIRHAAARVTAFLFMVRNAPFEVTAFPSVGQVTIPAKIPPDVAAALGHSDYMRRRP